VSKSIWDDEEPFRDGAPSFEGGQWKETETYTPAPDNAIRAAKIKEAQAIAAQSQEEYNVEELTEQVAEDEDEDFTEVLSDARLRLEQGKLYELIMNHSLFDGVDADPRAAKSVQKQIRTWAKTQMEIMLGMRQEPTVAGMVSSPFNNLEVDVLKKLASAASKGATESEEANEAPTVSVPVIQKKKTLNSIGSSKPQQKSLPKPVQKKVEPIQRVAKPKVNLPPEMEPDYEPLDKAIHEMTAAELAERDRQALERQRTRKAALPADRAPMPSFETQEMLALSQVSRATGNIGKGNLSALIVANLKGAGKI